MENLESVLMTYFYDMSEWLSGKKVKIEENIAKPKQSIVELMREDLKEIDSEIDSGIDDIFVNELKDSITELENMNEEDFIKLKKTILDFDPVTE